MAVVVKESDLLHYGIIRKSGRYPWGSGGNTEDGFVVQNNKSFLDWVRDLISNWGFTKANVAEALGIKTTELVAQISISDNELRASNIRQAQALSERGWGPTAIGERMGGADGPIPESTIREWLKPGSLDKATKLQNTANMLQRQVDEKGVIDISSGTEHQLGVSKDQLKNAAYILQRKGYTIATVKILQQGTNKETTIKFAARPEITQKDVWKDPTLIRLPTEYSNDNGRSFLGVKPPLAVDPKRVQVIYAEDGGAKADGVIYVRPGVDDVSLGGGRYAQVRVQVGDGHFLKGMAIYKDDLPPGVDIAFNTNKKKSDPNIKSDLDAMKPLKKLQEPDPDNPGKLRDTDRVDPDNPFGTFLKRQILADPNDPDSPVTSAMNLVYEEGNWNEWSSTIASQVLSKQVPRLAKTQLDATHKRREDELAEIMSLTNPTVKRKLLMEFADEADSAAVDLKAVGFPRQKWSAILPVEGINPTEIYAPNFDDGETVSLVRYPHGGTFEIPELRVNNRQQDALAFMDNARDAVGIHHSVAERLSGADFDGDTVLVIPTASSGLKSSRPLEGLKDFDPKSRYPGYEGMKVMSNTQAEMGKITNLITDMTIAGASTNDIARAVRHSMVVIDAEKHGLNYRESERVEGIKALKAQYQPEGGAATIVSRAKSRVYVPDFKDRPAAEGGPIDKRTGAKVTVPTGKINKKTGEPVIRRVDALSIETDARKLSSGTPVENVYADYSNKTKALANRARLEYTKTPRAEYSKVANKTYASEVAELKAALVRAESNAPLERRAQIIAGAVVKAKRDENPGMDREVVTKIKAQALNEARARVGAKKKEIQITDRQWEAIQAGALSDTSVTRILRNANPDKVKELATPRDLKTLTPSKAQLATNLLAAGNTRQEVANRLGVSLSTLDRALYGEE